MAALSYSAFISLLRSATNFSADVIISSIADSSIIKVESRYAHYIFIRIG